MGAFSRFFSRIGNRIKTIPLPTPPTPPTPPPAPAERTYYVATTGSNSNPGTLLAPFLTIQKAADVVVPGDTVIVRDGIYVNPTQNPGIEFPMVRIQRSGTDGNYITFKSEHAGGAVIHGARTSSGTAYNATHGILIDSGASYIKIEGFEISLMYLQGICVLGDSGHIEITGNYIHTIGNTLVTSTGDTNGRVGINLVNCSDIVIAKNRINDIGRLAPDEEGGAGAVNYLYNDHGIYISGVNGLSIRYNVITECDNGYALHFYSGANAYTTNATVYNNTLYTSNQRTSGLIVLSCPITTIDISNNLFIMDTETSFIGNPNNAIYMGVGYENYITEGVIRNNMMYRGSGAIVGVYDGLTLTGNIVNTNPLVTNFIAYSFTLTSLSPAINAGVDVGLTTDYAGTTVTGLPDIGAYEYSVA